jgi:hypothetical protein
MHILPPTPQITPVVHAPGKRGWPKLADREHRDSHCGGRNSAALVLGTMGEIEGAIKQNGAIPFFLIIADCEKAFLYLALG